MLVAAVLAPSALEVEEVPLAIVPSPVLTGCLDDGVGNCSKLDGCPNWMDAIDANNILRLKMFFDILVLFDLVHYFPIVLSVSL